MAEVFFDDGRSCSNPIALNENQEMPKAYVIGEFSLCVGNISVSSEDYRTKFNMKEPSFWGSFGGIGTPEPKLKYLSHKDMDHTDFKFNVTPCMAFFGDAGQGYAWKPEFENKAKTPREFAKYMGWRIVGARMRYGKSKYYAVDDESGEMVMGWSE